MIRSVDEQNRLNAPYQLVERNELLVSVPSFWWSYDAEGREFCQQAWAKSG